MELDDLLRMVVDSAMNLLDADRATIFLYDAHANELYTQVAEGAKQFRIPIETGIAGAAALSMKIINIPDAYLDDRFNQTIDKKTGYRTRSVLAIPLADYDGKLVGVLQVLNKRDGIFDENDEMTAQALSAQAGVALQRAQLLEERLEKQRMEDALRVAEQIQRALLPKTAQQIPGFDIACFSQACDAIGGDYSDLMLLSDTRLVVSFGDVAGHGVGPALVSCAARAMLRALGAIDVMDIETTMRWVNRLLTADLPDNRFITAFFGVLDANTASLTYCSAGQAPLLWYRNDKNTIERRRAGAIPIGIMDEFPDVEIETVDLAPNDLFILLTDGFYEWARADAEMFGTERVEQVVLEHRHSSSADILAAIRNSVEAFANTPSKDDLTAIVIKRTATSDRA